MKNKIKSILLYAGFSGPEFEMAWPALMKINTRVMEFGSVVTAVMMAIMYIVSYTGIADVDSIFTHRNIYLAFFVVSVAIVGMGLYVNGKHKEAKLSWVYVFEALVMLFGTIVSVYQNDQFSMVFVILMVFLPICFCDKPIRAMFFQLVWVVIMLCGSYHFKSYSTFLQDLILSVVFLVIDMVVSTFYMYVKTGAAVNNIKLAENQEELTAAIDNLKELRAHLTEQVEEQTWLLERRRKKYQNLSNQIMTSMSAAIDAKDNYTNGHSYRVAIYSKLIAERCGWPAEKQEEIYYIGLLHDIGKIGIPDTIINKPARLTDEEFAIIKTHPAIGSKILDSISEIPELSIGAHWHHERFDGRGYPDGLAGTDIPEIARIIGVADAYDAMTSNRSYRDTMPQEKVREQISNGIGTQFDPEFAKVMLQLIDEDTRYLMKGSTFNEAGASPFKN